MALPHAAARPQPTERRSLPRRWSVPTALSLIAMALAAGHLFGRWYMRTGWGLGWRTSQFFFNWQDLGFVNRGLVGTLLHPFPAVQRTEVFFATSWLMVGGFTAAFVALFRRAEERLEPAAARRLLMVCVASPALFLRQGFDLGRFDPLGLAAAILSLLAIERGRTWVAGLLSAVALLAHEAYLVIAIPLLVAWLAMQPSARPRDFAVLLALPAVVTAVIGMFGRYEPGLEALTLYFGGQPRYLAAKGGTVDVDAIAVLTRGLTDNFEFMVRMLREKRAWLHMPIILAWGGLMTAFFAAFYRLNGLRPDPLFWACSSPLLLSSIACDHYRWVALAATNMFIAIMLQVPRLAARGLAPRIPAGWLAGLLVATAVLGPISNTKSFPLLFVILGRLFPGLISE